MTELFPGIKKGMKGGQKQRWFNAHLDLVLELHERVGFETALEMLDTKPETLIRVLKRAEKRHRPAITKADKAMLQVQSVDVRLDRTMRELHIQAEELMTNVNKLDQLQENLKEYFELQARLNDFMSKLMASAGSQRANNFTYHILRNGRQELELTHEKNELKPAELKKVGPTEKVDRLLHSGRPDHRSRAIRPDLHNRHSRFQRRRRYA